jgi:hypothetical protein
MSLFTAFFAWWLGWMGLADGQICLVSDTPDPSCDISLPGRDVAPEGRPAVKGSVRASDTDISNGF